MGLVSLLLVSVSSTKNKKWSEIPTVALKTYILLIIGSHDKVHARRSVLVSLYKQWEAFHELDHRVELCRIGHLLLDAFFVLFNGDALRDLSYDLISLTIVLEHRLERVLESSQWNL